MDMLSIEKKWQKIWEEQQLYKFDKTRLKDKYYVLAMFSYPSGANLHVGHWYNYGPTDSFARFKRMQGYNVFNPMGFDAFGLPAENYAIKTKIHPFDSTAKNISTMEKQLKRIGASYDWDYEIVTSGEDYYKWTQWMFLELYKKGLAYRKEAPVNWCDSCNTVLANEQVVDGECERCGHTVYKKNLTQWFFKITDYAEELLADLDTLDWPEKTIMMQRNWIGKSQGGEIEFQLVGGKSFRVFTTRADTLFGVSYVVLAPENPLVTEIMTKECEVAVRAYIEKTAKINEIERQSTTAEKTGVFTGAYAINPINNTKVPVWIADYVLASYGTGAVMGVPAHDERDFEFAAKYNLPVNKVIENSAGETVLPFTDDGVLVNSGEFNGTFSASARDKILEKLFKSGKGQHKTTYRLRDWLISRQRYWGAPIPIVYCDKCGTVPVPESDLPVRLPYNVDFTPDGKSPLSKCGEFKNTVCPCCGAPATREVDTMDTFVCSSWYYLRYPDAKNASVPFDKKTTEEMLPVDICVGGSEHACMHLLYARFFTKALRDMGWLNFSEPFKRLIHQGLILGPDGNKMSKSRGNVISPDSYVEEFGSDAFRLTLLFGFNYIEGGPWNEGGTKAIVKFLERIEKLTERAMGAIYGNAPEEMDIELNYVHHYTIQKVTESIENFSFNSAVARLMELVNALYKYLPENSPLFIETVTDLIKLLAPFAPHFCEEMFEKLGHKESVFNQEYPIFNQAAIDAKNVEIVIQINSKIKARLTIPKGLDNEETQKLALNEPNIKNAVASSPIRKVIIAPDKLVNIII